MTDISLLPENMRGREQEERASRPKPEETVSEGLKMHVPSEEPAEDIEIIEVDESELASVLADEPFMTRLTYQISLGIDKVKETLFAKKAAAPPPKLPPQFFTPPKAGLVTKPGAPKEAAGAPAKPSRPGVRITPAATAPKRVRVIRRVRKPVRVSLISARDLAVLTVNVPKRKWTLLVVGVMFAAILGGGFFFLRDRVRVSESRLADVGKDIDAIRAASREKLAVWSQYEDLQQRLTMLGDVLNNHIVISRVFDFLEMRTLPDVSYRSATFSQDGRLILDVIAGSYDAAARQLVAFESSQMVQSVDATQFTAQESGEDGSMQVTFQLLVGLNPAGLRGPLLARDQDRSEPLTASGITTTP